MGCRKTVEGGRGKLHRENGSSKYFSLVGIGKKVLE
jgi:hypothetical protein